MASLSPDLKKAILQLYLVQHMRQAEIAAGLKLPVVAVAEILDGRG